VNVWLLIGLVLRESSNTSQRKEAHLFALNPFGAFFIERLCYIAVKLSEC